MRINLRGMREVVTSQLCLNALANCHDCCVYKLPTPVLPVMQSLSRTYLEIIRGVIGSRSAHIVRR